MFTIYLVITCNSSILLADHFVVELVDLFRVQALLVIRKCMALAVSFREISR